MAHKISCIELLSLLVLSGFLFPGTIKFALSTGGTTSGCFESEREALTKLRGGFTDPSGRLASWVGKDCCNWRGIVCSNLTGRVVKINLHNLYVDDSLSGDLKPEQALGGEISPSLLDVKELKYLDLSMNNFGGTKLPGFIGSLKQLTYLNLSGASFGGTIPPSLGNLSRLQYLDLSNCFAESQNDLLWLRGLSSLKYLNLGAIDLSKSADHWLRAINFLSSLRELHLPNCFLSKLPLSLPFINVTSLEILDLSNDDFNSTLPWWLFNLTLLVHLDLNSNSLRGELPDEFANLASLQELDMSQNFSKLSVNNITGDITDFINGLARCNDSNLENLDLGNNQLSGNLPDSLGNLKKLRYLRFSSNSFQGSIPRTIGNSSSLKEFYVANNGMSGIPESFGQLSTLVAVDLSENLWEGVVTEHHLANLSSLTDLDLDKLSPNISLAFNIAPGWIPPFKLRYLNIRSCQLGPEFPTWLRNQNHLKTVVLKNARISGTIPEWFLQLNLQLEELGVAYNQLTGKPPTSLTFVDDQSNVDLSSNSYEGPLPMWSSNVTTLYLRDNHFSGPIPPNIGELMPRLTDLDISRNALNGTIPLSIGKMTNLTTLVISNNYLSGEIPRFWSNLPFLYILDMSNNSLSGPIPREVSFLSSLRFLILSNNNLSGKLPSSLRNCSSLHSLDLGENKFSGNIPAWIAESIPSLLILRLRSNSFTGKIPPQICRLSNLHIVDLSHNSLSGSIPPCIGNLTGLKVELTDADTERYEGRLTVVAKGRIVQYDQKILYLVNSLDLSDNRLSGEIPEALTALVRLWTLNLSMNHFTGRIPIDIGNLEWLETLDLSSNNLSGPLPPSITALTKLNHLKLSYNNLWGKIPTANQFQTLNDPSIYEGNVGLCGIPLPELCPGDEKQPQSPDDGGGNTKSEDGGDDLERLWLFLSIGLGFSVGFWGVCGTLILKKSWRDAYHGYVDRMKNKLIVATLIACRTD
ncbi:LOW QUALITY PROTEIN: receptor-like protein EIX2 [Eucalyptus grandis]|uniref:LOW QUALITY PROTEIN: receptor-like protein EIX2 n=1 Tax=Eucalyptus grandis TaxID=71139 RepID=UPI00192ED9B6|nr:LOW QUALITY PROTEIN: receptor-like protein EIX2 [Eucalyptus grandis]